MDDLAAWSEWRSFDEESVSEAPTTPGVYMLREGLDGPIVYVGMAGDRRGKGLRGRLRVYISGKGMVSGLGEAAMDRALADSSWLRDRLGEVEAGRAQRAKRWAAAAIARADLQVRWASTPTVDEARLLERSVLARSGAELWNRRR